MIAKPDTLQAALVRSERQLEHLKECNADKSLIELEQRVFEKLLAHFAIYEQKRLLTSEY